MRESKVKIVNKSNYKLPEYETNGSAGMDLRSSENYIIFPGDRVLVKTGLFIKLKKGYEAQIRPRSGLALKHGITVLNSPGTIDSDYTGELGIILINHSKENFEVLAGDRVAQIVFAKVARIKWNLVKRLKETIRGNKGFGSTGKK